MKRETCLMHFSLLGKQKVKLISSLDNLLTSLWENLNVSEQNWFAIQQRITFQNH